MRPHGIKPCNISRWGQLQGCMCLHTQPSKIPKPVIRAAKLTAVLAAAIYSIRQQSSSLFRVCASVYSGTNRGQWDRHCMPVCVSVCMCARSVLYLAALDSSASCSPNHVREVIQLMIEPELCVCVCVRACIFDQNGKALAGFSWLIATLL